MHLMACLDPYMFFQHPSIPSLGNPRHLSNHYTSLLITYAFTGVGRKRWRWIFAFKDWWASSSYILPSPAGSALDFFLYFRVGFSVRVRL